MRILVVEDEGPLREQLQSHLTAKGYSVDVAADGEEGLYFGREYPLDIAVIDLGLPKLSGIELIRQLRAEAFSFPILILTARGNWQDKVEGLEAGADDYLVKAECAGTPFCRICQPNDRERSCSTEYGCAIIGA